MYPPFCLCHISSYIPNPFLRFFFFWLIKGIFFSLCRQDNNILQLIIAVCVRPNQEEHGSKTYWVISHHILGYALIILIISNVYEGIGHQNFAAAKNWKWIYGAILGALVFTFLALELVRRVKFDVRSA